MSPAAVASSAKAKAKASKDLKSKKSSSAARKPRAYPTYHEMVKEAILALKERSGSSQFAIAKFIEGKQKTNLPGNFKKLLLIQLKKLVANGKLVKVKNSFKLPPKSTSTSAAPPKKSVPAKAKIEPKPKSVPVKRKAVTESKPKKVAKTASTKSPGKKVESAAKKAKPVKSTKKVKSIKSPKKARNNKSPAKKATVKKAKK